MSRRLYRVLENNHSAIIYRLITGLKTPGDSRYANFPFDDVYRYSNGFLEGYKALVSSTDSKPLERFFQGISQDWAARGFSIQDARLIVSAFRDVCQPVLEKWYCHNPHTQARIMLDQESYLHTVITIFTSIYHSVLVGYTKASHEIFERIFRETGDSIFSLEPDMTIKIINPAMEKFLGVTMEAVKGKKCHEVLKWKSSSRRCIGGVGCPVQEAFNKGEQNNYHEGAITIERGRHRWIGITASAVRNNEGAVEEIIMNLRDITLSRERQQQLEEEMKTFETLAETTRGIELKIPCMSEFVVTARAQAELIARRMNFKNEKIQDIKSAVGEACDNAIEHGSSHRGVDIRYRIEGANLVIEVEDYGPGFEIDEINDDLPSPFTEGGRGLFLIRNLVDGAEIISEIGKGTKVLMEISRKSEKYCTWKRERNGFRSEKRRAVM